ncbi:50S ribosomal protein L30e [Candidatus Micrarchaeota archaeon]|nr:50S ribosomal protein L30e [Candidatus Micrarchaeota archaeon]MBU1930040.1 50S ribosomal protein L30e [Candidatus Micrarchaeota archaeon]
MTIDTAKEIRRAVDTGKVVFGFRQTEKNVLKGKGQIVIVSRNCPQRLSEKIQYLSQIAGIPFFELERNALYLGSICGKPFLVSSLLVLDKGKSKVLEIPKDTPPGSKRTQKKRKPITKKTSKKGKTKKKKQPATKKIREKISQKKSKKATQKQKRKTKKTGKKIIKKGKTKKTKTKKRR